MAKQAKGKGRPSTVRISNVESADDFKTSSVAAKPPQKVHNQAEDNDEADGNDDEELEASTSGSQQSEDDEEESDEESDGDEVDEQSMGRLMKLLEDVDPAELGLEEMDEDDDDDEASGSDAEEDDEELLSEEDDDEKAVDEDVAEAATKSTKAVKAKEALAKKNEDTVLDRILDRFKLNASFFETQTLTCPEPLEITDVSDDLSRELQFYKLSLWAAQQASKLFKAANVPFLRPNDYYAEMLKTDEHMEKIRQKLLDDTANIKASEEAKKLRHLKKFGKQVQVEKVKEREKAKKDMNEKVKSFRKKRKAGDDDGAEFDIDTLDNDSRPSKQARRGGAPGGSRGKTRDQRNTKFGRPTTSRRPKENDRESAHADFGGRGRGRGGARGRGGGRGGGSGGRGGRASSFKQKRPGKSKRQ